MTNNEDLTDCNLIFVDGEKNQKKTKESVWHQNKDQIGGETGNVA